MKKNNFNTGNNQNYQKRSQIIISKSGSYNNIYSFKQNFVNNNVLTKSLNNYNLPYTQINKSQNIHNANTCLSPENNVRKITNMNLSKSNNYQNNKLNNNENNNIQPTFKLSSSQHNFDYNKILYNLEHQTNKNVINKKKILNSNYAFIKRNIITLPESKILTYNNNFNIIEHEILSPKIINPYVDRAFKISGSWNFQKIKNIIPENKLKKIIKKTPSNQKSITQNTLNNKQNVVKIINKTKNKNKTENYLPKTKIIKLSNSEINSINNFSDDIIPNIPNQIILNLRKNSINQNIKNSTQNNKNNNSNKNINNIIINNRINNKSINNEKKRNEAAKTIQNNYRAYINRKNLFLLKPKLLSESKEFIKKQYKNCTSKWKINLNNLENDTIFSIKNWQSFYPSDERFFLFDNGLIFENCIKIEKKPFLSIYEGEVNILNQKHGFGKLTTENNMYIGGWRFDKFTGWGKEYLNDGSILEGKFMNGLLCGKGILKNIKNDIYIGEFMNSLRNGKGDLKTKKIHYNGDFVNNKLNGNGILDFLIEGHKYEGQFIDNEINGYGIFKWKNGDVYEGEMKAGKMHGKGKYIFKSGQIIEGNFVDGNFQD